VIYTLRRGYRLKDRVLRAANVVVSSGPAPVS
jgi:molecular chaperone GrpE (heat shock protein)